MGPSSLRRFGMAVAGSLLLASGAAPAFGDSGGAGNDAADLGQGNGNLDRALPESAGVVSPLDALLDLGRALWRAVMHEGQVANWLTPADPQTTIAPATTIVDDGAPF